MSLVIFFKCTETHNAFALHFKQTLIGNFLWYGMNRFRLIKNRFSPDSVAPCRRLDQFSVLICQVQGQTVKLVFNLVLKIGLSRQFFRS